LSYGFWVLGFGFWVHPLLDFGGVAFHHGNNHEAPAPLWTLAWGLGFEGLRVSGFEVFGSEFRVSG